MLRNSESCWAISSYVTGRRRVYHDNRSIIIIFHLHHVVGRWIWLHNWHNIPFGSNYPKCHESLIFNVLSIHAKHITLCNKFNSFQPFCKICLDANIQSSRFRRRKSRDTQWCLLSGLWIFWKISQTSIVIQIRIF